MNRATRLPKVATTLMRLCPFLVFAVLSMWWNGLDWIGEVGWVGAGGSACWWVRMSGGGGGRCVYLHPHVCLHLHGVLLGLHHLEHRLDHRVVVVVLAPLVDVERLRALEHLLRGQHARPVSGSNG